MLRNLGFAAVLLVALPACSSSPAGPTTTTSSSTTTIVDDTCAGVEADTVEFMGDLIDQLDETRLAEFKETADWPEDLKKLERLGADLDIRASALGCDADAIRQAVFDRADLAPGGPLSEGLVDLLLSVPSTTEPTTATTTAPETTTSSPTTSAPSTTQPTSTSGG